MSQADTCYVIMLNRIPGCETSKETIAHHIEHIRRLDDLGILVMAGPFEDHPGGMVIVRADSIESARQIAESDPFISEGVRTFELRTWLLSTRENGYLR